MIDNWTCSRCSESILNNRHPPIIALANLEQKTLCFECYQELVTWLRRKE